MKDIFSQLKEPRFGIGEADPNESPTDWYPPNAFHTYWTLAYLSALKRDSNEVTKVWEAYEVDRRKKEMLFWSRQMAGLQVALHAANSSALDSDQLAWSLATLIRFEEAFPSKLSEQDLVRHALECLFSTQNDVGTWRHYEPLFHYRRSGNAYCYVFETFSILLKSTLTNTGQGAFVRNCLKLHCSQLMKLFDYARATAIPLSTSEKLFGWCSGHSVNRAKPESWATASVYSFAEALRRLLGIWTRDEALKTFSSPRVRMTPEKAEAKLFERGNNWRSSSDTSVADQLMTMFVNPVLMNSKRETTDPDLPPLSDDQARSAILFGPPGTSKTTLARAIADLIQWNYVELHPSHFVADGLPNVQRTADEIFRRLMELDRAVVLFDEIDELVRAREKEPDAFGRFLTTSMLPKLAELWDSRKILYFVNTNHIAYFDAAITRSGRFDALVFVSAPSFRAKLDELQRLLTGSGIDCEVPNPESLRERIDKSLNRSGRANDDLGQEVKLDQENGDRLAKFALLRWDQLEDLAFQVRRFVKDEKVTLTESVLGAALSSITDPVLTKRSTYQEYCSDAEYARRDRRMKNVWQIIGLTDNVQPENVVATNGKLWFSTNDDTPQKLRVTGYRLAQIFHGKCKFEREGTEVAE